MITSITRKNIVDIFTIWGHSWSGRLNDVDFLSRIYDLENMPSSDIRFRSAIDDITTHRLSFQDWQNDWVFYDERFELKNGPDEVFVRFLAESLHPAVRRPAEPVGPILAELNSHLERDGWRLQSTHEISGHPVYSGVQILHPDERLRGQSRAVRTAIGTEYIAQQDERIQRAISSADGGAAIGHSKEMLESVARTILNQRTVACDRNDDLPKLIKAVRTELAISPVKPPSSAARSFVQLASHLSGAVTCVAEIRNAFGTGHGHEASHAPIPLPHARLVASTALALATFLWDVHDSSRPSPSVPTPPPREEWNDDVPF